MNQPYSRNAELIPSDDLPPDNSTYRIHYQRNKYAGSGSTIGVVPLNEWWKFVHYDLWQVYCHLWGPATCAEFPCQVILAAYQHGLEAFGRGTNVNLYDRGGEAVAWLRGYHKAGQILRLAQSPHPALPIVSFLTVQREYIAIRKATRITRDRRLAALKKQAQRSIKKHPTNIDEFGHVWGGMMRYQPNGWYAKSPWAAIVEEAIAGENSITRIAHDSSDDSYGDAAASSVRRQHLWNRFSSGLRECFCSS